jgi:competence protein ComEC
LLTGDIEADRERELVRYWRGELASHWLLAAHHGSRTSSGPSFLKHVQPEVVVVSHGYANRFGHPHPVVARRLRDTADAVYSTARAGALTFEFSPSGEMRVDRHRLQQERYWK